MAAAEVARREAERAATGHAAVPAGAQSRAKSEQEPEEETDTASLMWEETQEQIRSLSRAAPRLLGQPPDDSAGVVLPCQSRQNTVASSRNSSSW
jgi:hypothetical protein